MHCPYGTLFQAHKRRRSAVEEIEECAKRRIPKRTLACVILQKPSRKIQIRDKVVVRSLNGVIGVTSYGRVCDGPYVLLLYGFVGECLPVVVLTKPYGLGLSILEANHVVLPVANVIAEFSEEDRAALVVGVEVHVEGVNCTIATVVDDDGRAGDVVGLARGVRNDAGEPNRLCSHVDVRRQVYIPAMIAIGVEDIEVLERG